MQAIVTKYHPASDRRGSHMTAAAVGGRASVGYDHGLDERGNHDAAAAALIVKMGWQYLVERHGLSSGGMPNGTDRAHVFGPSDRAKWVNTAISSPSNFDARQRMRAKSRARTGNPASGPLRTGYTSCACRDCMETAIGTPGEALCHDCEAAGCEAGADAECQSPHAYGGEAVNDIDEFG